MPQPFSISITVTEITQNDKHSHSDGAKMGVLQFKKKKKKCFFSRLLLNLLVLHLKLRFWPPGELSFSSEPTVSTAAL